jgi:hypothetical protein
LCVGMYTVCFCNVSFVGGWSDWTDLMWEFVTAIN